MYMLTGRTANIHVVIPVSDHYDDIDVVLIDNLAKSRELSGNSGHSPELRYK
jgi:hypothetical protein